MSSAVTVISRNPSLPLHCLMCLYRAMVFSRRSLSTVIYVESHVTLSKAGSIEFVSGRAKQKRSQILIVDCR